MKIAAYIHIPFCASKCLYCDFNSYPGRAELFEPYVDAVKAEIRQYAERFSGARIPTVYFGGGTPTLLSTDQLGRILGEIRSCFAVDADAEISTEANPGTLGDKLLPRTISGEGDLRNLFNRLSLGVQSLHDNELAQLGRIHTADEAVRAYREARGAGFANISIDLMYGIPAQTLESWSATLAGVLALNPEHVSLYSLTVEAGTPFFEMYNSGNLSLPGEDIEADMYELAIETFTSAGYLHYEISNFARPGFECAHNLTYWHNEPYFGFGAGATSYLDGDRATNERSIEGYIERIQSGKSAIADKEHLTGKAAMGETVFLGLRTLSGIEVDAFTRRYGLAPRAAFPSQIEGLIARGLLAETPSHIRLTHTGLLFANDVFAEFVGWE